MSGEGENDEERFKKNFRGHLTAYWSAKHLCKVYKKQHVLNDICFDLHPGEVLGLVGMSGSGKSTIAKCIIGMEKPTSGEILWNGQSLLKKKQRLASRQHMQIVFQDPRSSLNPRWKIVKSIVEPLKNKVTSKNEDKITQKTFLQEAQHYIQLAGLETKYLDYYPHQLSTGQCQRVCIARALAPRPKLLILDEPLSALDVSIQAQMIKLLKKLHQEQGVGYLFISHDIAVVASLCERMIVLNQGEIVEETNRYDFIENPKHEYTRSLIKDALLEVKV